MVNEVYMSSLTGDTTVCVFPEPIFGIIEIPGYFRFCIDEKLWQNSSKFGLILLINVLVTWKNS